MKIHIYELEDIDDQVKMLLLNDVYFGTDIN